jgi:hypothetical protein
MAENQQGAWDGIQVKYLRDLKDRNHNVLENRDVQYAHPASAISGILQGDISLYRRSGQYYSMHYAGSNNVGLPLSAQIQALPFVVINTITISMIAIDVSVNGGAGSKSRLGIYADNGLVYPGSLLVDSGVTDNSATGVKQLAIYPNLELTNGLYWIVGALDGNGNIRCITNQLNIIGSTVGNFDYPGGIWYKTGDYTAALPSVFPSGADAGASSALIQVKIG